MVQKVAMKSNAGRTVMLIAAAVLLCGQAEPPPATTTIDPDGSVVVQELEVYGRYPGPALWKVNKGAGEVTILGSLSPLPHMLEWKSPRLERALDQAQVVILPPNGRVGVFEALNLILHAGDLFLPRPRTLWDEVTPEERRRFENLLGQIGGKPERYIHLKPAVAGLTLLAEFDKGAGLSQAKPASTVEAMAKARRIRIRTYGKINAPALLHAITHMDADTQKACLDDTLGEAEHNASQARPLAQAWANGDLKTVRAGYRRSLEGQCITELRKAQETVQRAENDAVAAIDELLGAGGKAVAVVDLTLLQRRDGVLDRLKAEGAEITVPRE